MKMEHYKISKLLNNQTLPKFVTKKLVKVSDQGVNIMSTKM